MTKHPLMIGIYASLIAAIITYVFAEMTSLKVLTIRIPIWMLIISILFLIVISSTYSLYRLSTPKQVFIILSQFLSKSFFASLSEEPCAKSAGRQKSKSLNCSNILSSSLIPNVLLNYCFIPFATDCPNVITVCPKFSSP